jgi:hypothetical protein
VWSTLPKHTPSTCDLDTVVINLIQQRRQLESTGGNVSEFTRHAFPSIQSLLNPTYEPLASPVTSTIVKNIIHVMTVPTLPEQIAILYVMSKVIRWQISPTQANYFDLPEWLRPTPSQLIHTHPPWLDLFLWPKGREKMCREKKYHNEHELMAEICNATLSINWPHKPSDMIMQVSGRETVLHPMFEKHILDLGNWTVGKKILEAYPDLVFEVNVKPP